MHDAQIYIKKQKITLSRGGCRLSPGGGGIYLPPLGGVQISLPFLLQGVRVL